MDGDVTWPLTVAHSIPFAWGITSVDAAAGGAWLLAAGAVLALVLVDLALLWSWQRLVVRYFNGKVAESAGATSVQLKNQGRDIRTGWRASRRAPSSLASFRSGTETCADEHNCSPLPS